MVVMIITCDYHCYYQDDCEYVILCNVGCGLGDNFSPTQIQASHEVPRQLQLQINLSTNVIDGIIATTGITAIVIITGIFGIAVIIVMQVLVISICIWVQH